jgi:hypothetical protein
VSDEISDEERDLELRMRNKLLGRNSSESGPVDTNCSANLPVEFHFYTHEIADDRGGVDTYWRFDRLQGQSSTIHREFNSKALAMMELNRLRGDGFTVHVIQTPETMTLEGKEKTRRELHARWMELHGGLKPSENRGTEGDEQ